MRFTVVVSVVVWSLSASVVAQDDDDVQQGWADEAELSLVFTDGNSAARTFGFSNVLRYAAEDYRLQIQVSGLRSDTSDDPFLLVDPGISFPVGGVPETVTTSLVRPGPEPDVENYLVSGRYDRSVNDHLFWSGGGSWDRNSDAGILNRSILFAGLGSRWHDTETFRFTTTYGVSFTDREEETPDDEKDDRFAGARLGWDYLNLFFGTTTFENRFTTNVNLSDPTDYSMNLENVLSVAMNAILSVRLGLQFLYENEPALEDVDIVARALVLDPDGIPGTGDETFQTVATGGSSILVGADRVRKNELDTIFRTTLVISF